jgi:hypothetical protein
MHVFRLLDYSPAVPSLPPPNEHAPSVLFRLNSLRELVAPLNPNKDHGNKDSDRARVAHRFLKKVKGIQSLGLQLSWVFVVLSFLSPFPRAYY